MSTRSLRTRLDRLTRANSAIGQEKDHASDFTIDPALAKALRDDYEHLKVLLRKRWEPSKYGGPPSATEMEEARLLRARIAERARAIGCPPGYGPQERRTDSDRLHKFLCKRLSPPLCGGGPFSDAEDAEEAQLTARLAAFHESPEGRARERIGELFLKSFRGLSTAEQNERDNLKSLYPDLPPDPNDPMKGNYEAWNAAAKKAEEESFKRSQQRLDRIARRRTGD